MQITEETARRLVEAIDRLTEAVKQSSRDTDYRFTHSIITGCGGPGATHPDILPSEPSKSKG